MKGFKYFARFAGFIVWLSLCGSPTSTLAQLTQSTAFMYSGHLLDGGSPANGTYDFKFTLYADSAGTQQVGFPITYTSIAVSNGDFSVSLDFGRYAFNGSTRWLLVSVRNGVNWVDLTPLQQITPTPYAIYAISTDATNVSGTLSWAQLPANIARLDAASPATGTVSANSGRIVATSLISGGFGYSTAPAVTVNDPTGSGAVIVATVANGSVTGLTIQNEGSGYTSPTLTIAPPPADAGQTFAGIVSLNNPNNTLAGDGSGLTGLNNVAPGQVVKSLNGLSDAINVTAGPNVSVNTSGNNISIAAGGASQVPWQVVSGTNQQAQPNTGYLCTNDAQTVITLPASPAVGDIVRVSGAGSGGWKIVQNAGQSMLVRNSQAEWIPTGPNEYWTSLACSSNGTKLAACGTSQIWTSTDSGVSWTPHGPSNIWVSVASSADGAKLVAATYPDQPDQLYTSSDSGVTWTPHGNAHDWNDVASSADGTKLAASCDDAGIFTSTDSGNTWTERAAGIEGQWIGFECIASSADGTRLIAGGADGRMYTSSDSGVTWVAHGTNAAFNAVSVTSSSDGTRLALVSQFPVGRLYTSTDSGMTWTNWLYPQDWSSIAGSADGLKYIAASIGYDYWGGYPYQLGGLYVSDGYDWNWLYQDASRMWYAVAMSADGNTLAAVSYFGPIYLYSNASTTTTAGASGFLLGAQDASVELQYVGNGLFILISHEGMFAAY